MRRRDRLRLAIVPDKPNRPWYIVVAMIMVAAIFGAVGFGFGQHLAGEEAERAQAAIGAVVKNAEKRITATQESAAIREREFSIIEEASRRMRDDNQELLATMSSLEDRVIFYKRMVSPKAVTNDLGVEFFELLPGSADNKVRYRLLVTRNSMSGSVAQGAVTAKLVSGSRNVSLPLEAPRFQFRYYQQFTGEWTVPAGFNPERVDIRVSAGRLSTERRYKWEVKGS